MSNLLISGCKQASSELVTAGETKITEAANDEVISSHSTGSLVSPEECRDWCSLPAACLKVRHLPCGFLQGPQGSRNRHVSPHSGSCIVWFVHRGVSPNGPSGPPAFTGSSHPTRTGAKMVLNDRAEHRCSAPGSEHSWMTQVVSHIFSQNSAAYFCLFFFLSSLYRSQTMRGNKEGDRQINENFITIKLVNSERYSAHKCKTGPTGDDWSWQTSH